MVKVISENTPCHHYHVYCQNCDYTDSAKDNANINAVRKRIKKHCIETGHTVTAEKSSSITYKCVKNKIL